MNILSWFKRPEPELPTIVDNSSSLREIELISLSELLNDKKHERRKKFLYISVSDVLAMCYELGLDMCVDKNQADIMTYSPIVIATGNCGNSKITLMIYNKFLIVDYCKSIYLNPNNPINFC